MNSPNLDHPRIHLEGEGLELSENAGVADGDAFGIDGGAAVVVALGLLWSWQNGVVVGVDDGVVVHNLGYCRRRRWRYCGDYAWLRRLSHTGRYGIRFLFSAIVAP